MNMDMNYERREQQQRGHVFASTGYIIRAPDGRSGVYEQAEVGDWEDGVPRSWISFVECMLNAGISCELNTGTPPPLWIRHCGYALNEFSKRMQ